MTQSATASIIPSKGEIWLVNLDPTIGDELRKIRPAVIVSADALGVLSLRTVVPLTNWQDKFSSWEWLVRIDPTAANGLTKPSAADTFQVRSVSTRRLVRRLGRLSDGEIERIQEGLKAVFEL
jgi:mRNA interferase MazF